VLVGSYQFLTSDTLEADNLWFIFLPFTLPIERVCVYVVDFETIYCCNNIDKKEPKSAKEVL
jgi:hypothetical protein